MQEETNTSGSSPSGTDAAPVSGPTRKITNDKPDHWKATVAMSMNGLALLCTNPHDRQVEIGFVEDMHSPVSICIDGPGGKIPRFHCERGKKYLITVTRMTPQDMGEFYEDGMKVQKDPEDFRWMPDLHRLHPLGIDIQRNAKSALSAKLVIKDAVFYTAALSTNTAAIEDTTGTVPTENTIIGRVLGADITCPSDSNDAGVVVRVWKEGTSDPVFDQTLSKATKPYKIAIETIAEMPGDHMHMLYHNVITVSEPSRFRIVYQPGEPPIHNCGSFVGDSKEKVFYPEGLDKATLIGEDNRERFESYKDAVEAGFSFHLMSEQYACQPLPDGDGPLPEFP